MKSYSRVRTQQARGADRQLGAEIAQKILTSMSCCSSACLAPTLCPAEPPGGMRFDAERPGGEWLSVDPKLRSIGVRYLQVGGDTWNRCGNGWLNLDGNFDRGDGAIRENLIFKDDTDRFNMKHIVSPESRLPFANNSVQIVYSEHMMEHMLPFMGGGVNFLKEAWRVLAPGGVLRIVTPDLDKYVCGMIEGRGGGGGGGGGDGGGGDSRGSSDTNHGGHRQPSGFLERHAARFQPMEILSREPNDLKTPPSRATIFNNIFRNYGHQWVYNLDELKLAAVRAGFGATAGGMCRSDRRGRGLPRWARNAMRRANAPKNATQQCWLDQEVREGESMYVVAYKPRARGAAAAPSS